MWWCMTIVLCNHISGLVVVGSCPFLFPKHAITISYYMSCTRVGSHSKIKSELCLILGNKNESLIIPEIILERLFGMKLRQLLSHNVTVHILHVS